MSDFVSGQHMSGDETLLGYRLQQAEREIDQLEKDVSSLHREIEAIRKDSDDRERKRLLWGISALGSVIIALAGVIWSYRGVIFK